jgi:hypothetical protein
MNALLTLASEYADAVVKTAVSMVDRSVDVQALSDALRQATLRDFRLWSEAAKADALSGVSEDALRASMAVAVIETAEAAVRSIA